MRTTKIHSPRTIASTLALAAVALASAGAPLPAQEVERYTLSGDDVAVYDLAGAVELVAGSGSDVVVEVRRGGRDAGALRVAAGDVRGRESLRVIFPEDDVVYPDLGRRSRSTMRVRGDGTFGDGDWTDAFRGDRVTIRGSGSGTEAYADLRVAVPAGRRISVYLGVGRANVRNVQGDLRVDASAAPVRTAGTRGSLWIDTGSGSVSVTDAEGEVEVDTGSGGVELSRIRGPRAYVDTGSGSVTAADVTVGSLLVDTGSGRIRVAGVTADEVNLDTGSGRVDVELLSDVRSLIVDTGSGSVTVAVPADLGADVEIDTGSGGIDLDIPLTVTNIERSHVRGRIGGGGGRIEIDTGSGSVRLTRS